VSERAVDRNRRRLWVLMAGLEDGPVGSFVQGGQNGVGSPGARILHGRVDSEPPKEPHWHKKLEAQSHPQFLGGLDVQGGFCYGVNHMLGLSAGSPSAET
jgi:hypothetical protein